LKEILCGRSVMSFENCAPSAPRSLLLDSSPVASVAIGRQVSKMSFASVGISGREMIGVAESMNDG
jgi:hypothetical protein